MRANRDPLLDLWRGIALLDMVLVHLAWNGIGLPEPLDTMVKHYTRFAAGGFVLIAGLTIGTVFGPRLRGPWSTRLVSYRWLWRRALLLVAIDRVASVAMLVVESQRPFTTVADTYGWRDVLLFRAPGVTGGLLALYSLLLSLTPVLFELSRRVGPAFVAVLSFAIYAVVDAVGGPWHWPPWSFPLGSWQPIYVLGLVSAPLVPWVRAGGARRSGAWLAGALGCFGVLFVARFGADFGLGWVVDRLALDFTKVPLRPGGLLWYLAASQLVLAGSLVVWDRIAAIRPRFSWLITLGRNSLAVYVAHLFTEVPIVDVIWGAWPRATVRTSLAALDVAALVVLARWIERGRAGEPRPRSIARPPAWFPRPAWAVCVTVAASALALAAVRLGIDAPTAVAASATSAVPAAPDELQPALELVDAPAAEPVVGAPSDAASVTSETAPI